METKIYSEFFTNLAVAWFTVGVLTPFFTIPQHLDKIGLFVSVGVVGSLASLKLAVMAAKGGNL